MDQIEILQERQDDLLLELKRQDLTQKEFDSVSSELAEVGIALQKAYAPFDTIGDAKLCARFGMAL